MASVAPKADVKHYKMYIDGRWTGAASGETYEVVDPASEEADRPGTEGGRRRRRGGGPRRPRCL